MKTRKVLCALAFAAGAATAHAAPLSFEDAVISASYQGAPAGMLGLDHLFEQVPGSHTSRLDPLDGGVEFLTSDYLFGIDFSKTGALTVFANGTIAPGAYAMRFDFGGSLGGPIGAFALVGANGASGVPGLSIVDAHTIALDLSNLAWSEYGSFTAQIEAAGEVPEPAGAAIVLAGLAAMAGAARARKRQA